VGVRTVAATRRAVFLDRDGVLSKALVRDGKPYAPATLDEFEINQDAGIELARLRSAGYLLVVITNQPDVGRGKTPRAAIEAMNTLLRETFPLDDVLVCWHDDSAGCNCRKPRPGLFLEAASRHGIDLAASFMVGDRWRDIDAGAAAGCRTILIDHGYQERAPEHAPDAVVQSLAAATDSILSHPAPPTSID
jgi:D-glycero-D-manno-heptose 1,7-bisphosphate phosphatase